MLVTAGDPPPRNPTDDSELLLLDVKTFPRGDLEIVTLELVVFVPFLTVLLLFVEIDAF